MSTKSPFLIVPNAISPLACEEIVDSVDFAALDVDRNDKPIETTKLSEFASEFVHNEIHKIQDVIRAKYGSKISFVDQTRVIWSNSDVVPRVQSDNSVKIKDKWLRVRNRDLTAVVFLCDFNDKPPFDSDFEVYGGKLEFPAFNFGFNSIRGTMVIMPSDPPFNHVYSPVYEGHLFISKTFITLEQPFIYTRTNFPGSWSEWLKEHF